MTSRRSHALLYKLYMEFQLLVYMIILEIFAYSDLALKKVWSKLDRSDIWLLLQVLQAVARLMHITFKISQFVYILGRK